jgi:hypothetical protein
MVKTSFSESALRWFQIQWARATKKKVIVYLDELRSPWFARNLSPETLDFIQRMSAAKWRAYEHSYRYTRMFLDEAPNAELTIQPPLTWWEKECAAAMRKTQATCIEDGMGLDYNFTQSPFLSSEARAYFARKLECRLAWDDHEWLARYRAIVEHKGAGLALTPFERELLHARNIHFILEGWEKPFDVSVTQ